MLSPELYEEFMSGIKPSYRKFTIPYSNILHIAKKLYEDKNKSEIRFINLYRTLEGIQKYTLLHNFPIENKFIGDFVNIQNMFIIEVDGSIHEMTDVRIRDKERESRLKKAGWRILRLNTKGDNNTWIRQLAQFILSIETNKLPLFNTTKRSKLCSLMNTLKEWNGEELPPCDNKFWISKAKRKKKHKKRVTLLRQSNPIVILRKKTTSVLVTNQIKALGERSLGNTKD